MMFVANAAQTPFGDAAATGAVGARRRRRDGLRDGVPREFGPATARVVPLRVTK